MKFFATCKIGLESLVGAQLKDLGITVVAVRDARVDFSGSFDDMAKACLWLRTAERVLMEVGSFRAVTFDELFEGVRALEWKRWLRRDTFIHVTGKSAKSALFSVSDCQSIAKKAIVENLRAAFHTSVIPETGDRVIVEIGILRDEVTVALDCCGAGLSRRGYRTYNVEAPLSETLGAAIVELMGYDGLQTLVDPMCGSGTMPIEAAMISCNIAPGLLRAFAAEKWGFIDGGTFAAAREAARDAAVPMRGRVYGSDIDAHSIDLCKKHAKKAGVMLDWAVKPVKELRPVDESGIIVCNPPYGERMLERREAEALYRQLHQAFAAFPDWRKGVITSHRCFEQIYGIRADRRRKLSNGGMECTLYMYYPPKK